MKTLENETELLRKIQKSNEAAFHLLFKYYHPFLFKQIYYQIQDSALAQDILQETFLKNRMKRKFLKPDQSFYAYLSIICNWIIKAI